MVAPERSPLDQAYSDGEPTLGDLKPADITISKQALKPIPAEAVIDTYKQALVLFSKPEERLAILRRMADLTMVGSEEKLLAELDGEDLEAPEPSIESASTELDVDGLEADIQSASALTYNNAIELYLEIINNAAPGIDMSESYYLLAKAYDLNGSPEKSLETLDQLVDNFPGSEYHAEAQFRRGEQLFQLGEYELAADAYKEVLSFREKTPYYDQSLYKHGWSLYKLGDYDLSISDFVALMDIYMPPPPPPRDNYSNQGPPSQVSVYSNQSNNDQGGGRWSRVWIPN